MRLDLALKYYDEQKIASRLTVLMTFMLCLKIGSYFSISESRAITQVYKVISRMAMTGMVIWVWQSLPRWGIRQAFGWKNTQILWLYCAYLFLGFASILWSSNYQRSALQWFMTSETLPFALLWVIVFYCSNRDLKQHKLDPIRIFYNAITPICIIFIIGSFTDPDTFYRGMRGGEEQRLGGWIMNPNELGMLAGIGTSLCFLDMVQRKFSALNIFSILINTWCLALTTSRSSFIGLFVIMGLLVLRRGSLKLKLGMLIIGAAAMPFVLQEVIFKSGGGVEEVMSMTGRLPFWKALLNEAFIEQPWLGYGWMRIYYTDVFAGVHTYPAMMTHNTFVQAIMNLGIIGISICLIQFFTTIYFILKSNNLFFLAVFVPITINSITEFGIFGETNYGILYYQLLIAFLIFYSVDRLTLKQEITYKKKGGIPRFGKAPPSNLK